MFNNGNMNGFDGFDPSMMMMAINMGDMNNMMQNMNMMGMNNMMQNMNMNGMNNMMQNMNMNGMNNMMPNMNMNGMNNMMPNMNMNGMSNIGNNQQSRGKINVVFVTTQGLETVMNFDYEASIKDALELYLKRVGRPELINSNIEGFNFIHNAHNLKMNDNRSVGSVFGGDIIARVVVNDVHNLIGA